MSSTMDIISSGGRFLVLWLVLVFFLSRITGILYPAFRSMGGQASPAAEALSLLLYSTIAPVVAVLIVVLVLHPELSNALIPFHCHDQDCSAHRPQLTAHSAFGLVTVALTTFLMLVCAAVIQLRLRTAQRRLQVLSQLSRAAQSEPFILVDSATPFAWSTGILKPEIYLSRSLLTLLDEQQLEAVILHELAHGARRDNLRRTVVQLACRLWPKRARRALLQDFNVSTEKACDAIAARQMGDSSPLAAALRKLALSANAGTATDAQTFADRILAIERSSHSLLLGRWLFLLLLWSLPIVLLTGIGHRVVEWLPL